MANLKIFKIVQTFCKTLPYMFLLRVREYEQHIFNTISLRIHHTKVILKYISEH